MSDKNEVHVQNAFWLSDHDDNGVDATAWIEDDLLHIVPVGAEYPCLALTDSELEAIHNLATEEEWGEFGETQRKLDAYKNEQWAIEQILGEALHYPRYVDDKKSFPLANYSDGVCVGDHTPVSLAMEAARIIEELRVSKR